MTDATNELKTSVSDGKSAIAAAVTGKGVNTAASDSFSTMATNIGAIQQLDTSDATATAAQILNGSTAYVKGIKITGTAKLVKSATISIYTRCNLYGDSTFGLFSSDGTISNFNTGTGYFVYNGNYVHFFKASSSASYITLFNINNQFYLYPGSYTGYYIEI